MGFGSMKAVVKFANADVVKGNSNYGLEGATFEVVRNGVHVGVMSTGADGVAVMENLAPGIYEVHQISPCKGGACDPSIAYSVSVRDGEQSTLNASA